MVFSYKESLFPRIAKRIYGRFIGDGGVNHTESWKHNVYHVCELCFRERIQSWHKLRQSGAKGFNLDAL